MISTHDKKYKEVSFFLYCCAHLSSIDPQVYPFFRTPFVLTIADPFCFFCISPHVTHINSIIYIVLCVIFFIRIKYSNPPLSPPKVRIINCSIRCCEIVSLPISVYVHSSPKKNFNIRSFSKLKGFTYCNNNVFWEIYEQLDIFTK